MWSIMNISFVLTVILEIPVSKLLFEESVSIDYKENNEFVYQVLQLKFYTSEEFISN